MEFHATPTNTFGASTSKTTPQSQQEVTNLGQQLTYLQSELEHLQKKNASMQQQIQQNEVVQHHEAMQLQMQMQQQSEALLQKFTMM